MEHPSTNEDSLIHAVSPELKQLPEKIELLKKEVARLEGKKEDVNYGISAIEKTESASTVPRSHEDSLPVHRAVAQMLKERRDILIAIEKRITAHEKQIEDHTNRLNDLQK